MWPSWPSSCLKMTYLIYSVYLGTADDLPEGGKKLLSLSPLPAAKNPPPSVHLKPITKWLPVTVIWLSILTILNRLWIVYASLSYGSEGDCTGLGINFWSVSFLIFLFVGLADLSMGKKGALGKLLRITSRTLVFYNQHVCQNCSLNW